MEEKIEKIKRVLSKKEEKELEVLNNPDVNYLAPVGGFFAIIFDSFFHRSSKIKKRVVYLRTKMRMNELGIDQKKERQRYQKIKAEEERRFDKRFKNYKRY